MSDLKIVTDEGVPCQECGYKLGTNPNCKACQYDEAARAYEVELAKVEKAQLREVQNFVRRILKPHYAGAEYVRRSVRERDQRIFSSVADMLNELNVILEKHGVKTDAMTNELQAVIWNWRINFPGRR